MIVYKIRRKTDGLFSKGGSQPFFDKKGKVWSNRGHVSNHMNQVTQKKDCYKDCEVVTYELVENELDTIPALEWSVTKETARAKQLQEEGYLQWRKEQRLKEIQRLEDELRKLKK